MADQPLLPNSNPAGNKPTPPDRIDPDVKLPPAVAAAIARGNEVHAQVYNPTSPPAGSETTPSLPPGTPPPNGALHGQDDFPETNTDGSPNWENRFKALKGRYDADTRRSRETSEATEQRLRDLAQENQSLRTRPLAQDVKPPVLLSAKEIEDYGPELIDVVKRAAQEAVMPMLGTIATEVGQLKGRQESTENETGRQFMTRMNGAMDATVPGWSDLNRDPNFIAWTKRPDIYSGLNRQDLLQKAWYAGDSNRVAAFFQGFLAEEAATDPAAAEVRQRTMAAMNGGHAPLPNGGAPASPSPTQAPRVTLESLAAPGRARAAVTPPQGKPVWTAEGISQFYIDCANGKFRNREAERAATEADLMSAQREGRIIVNPRTATSLQGH